MELLTKETFEKVLKDDKAVVMFYRAKGCGNCERMKPQYEELSKLKTQPEIKFYLYECGSAPDEISKQYPFRTFPGVFCFEKGLLIDKLEAVFPIGEIITSFASLTQLKAATYDLQVLINQGEQAKQSLQRVDMLIQRKSNPQPPIIQQTPKKEDDWDLGKSEAPEPEVCEGCQ